MKPKLFRRVLAAAGGLLLAACSATGYPIQDLAAEINATLDTAPAKVQPGDRLSLRFPFKAEWNHETRVRPDGVATFLLIDDLKVDGLTLVDLDRRLTEAYVKQRAGQESSIELTVQMPDAGGSSEGAGAAAGAGAGGPVAYVVGEVQSPGAVQLAGRTMTLFEAIASAGGHRKATANLSNTILIRRVAATGAMRSWRLDADIYGWGSVPPIFLQPRDIVFVPNTAIDEVDIWVDQYIRQMIPLPFLVPPAQ